MNTILIGIAAILMFGFGHIYIKYKPTLKKRVLPFKGLATLMPVLLVLISACEQPSLSKWLIFTGLIFCLTADILLEIYLPAGILCFAMAHIALICAFHQFTVFKLYTLIIIILIEALFVCSYKKYFKKHKKLFKFAAVYVIFLGSMCATAITTAITTRTPWAVCAGAGGIMFVISDYMLSSAHLQSRTKGKRRRILLILYYTAVFLIGIAGCYCV